MYCHNCGKKIENQISFCPLCGAKINSQVVFLPKNHNFLMVLLSLFTICIICITYLIAYNYKYDFTNNITHLNNRFYYPIGYLAKIGTEDEKDKKDEDKCVFIYNNSISYQLCYTKYDYSLYKKDNYQSVSKLLTEHGYTINNIKEINDNTILGELAKSDKYYSYFYIYNYKNNEEIIYGYIVSKTSINDSDIDRLSKILSKVQKEE